ncbi:potassium channel family protein [Terrisporobacter sp.]
MNCKWVSRENRNLKCNRHADSSGYCLFHKQNKSKKEIALFEQYIKRNRISDFTGFYFEDKFEIKKLVNHKYEKLKFCEAVFKEYADFTNYKFKSSVDFTNAKFKSYVNFKNSKFLSNCIFKRTIFNEKYINEEIFQKSNFEGQKLIVEKCINFPRLDGVIFSPCTKFILKDTNYNMKDCICGRTNYRIARIQAKNLEDNENMGYYYYNERNYASNLLKCRKYNGYKDYLASNFFDFLSKNLIGYGQKPIRLLLISFTLISVFAFIYILIGIKSVEYGLIKINLFSGDYSIYDCITFYLEAWYFSMITFSTVGYGDIIACGLLCKIIVCIEVFLGITIHATWTSVLFSRMIK